MTLIQAQDKFINRVNSCHTGHYNRVLRSASRELWQWAVDRGYTKQDACVLVEEALDVAKLIQASKD